MTMLRTITVSQEVTIVLMSKTQCETMVPPKTMKASTTVSWTMTTNLDKHKLHVIQRNFSLENLN